MQPATALHTAARRYCVERGARLTRRAKLEWQRTPFTGAIRHDDTPWRWANNALRRLLHAIEAWQPEEEATLDATRARLLATAGVLDPATKEEPEAAAASADERDRFRRSVERLPAERLGAIEPLGSIRRLSPTKSRRVQEHLA